MTQKPTKTPKVLKAPKVTAPKVASPKVKAVKVAAPIAEPTVPVVAANSESLVIKKLNPPPPGIQVGKPKFIKSAKMMRMGTALTSVGNTTLGTGGNFYSPELSTDFLELPQSIDEQRNFYRFFYDNDPIVGQAIDLQGDIPLSKIRMLDPKDFRSKELAKKATKFCERWADDIDLESKLGTIVHEWNLIGEVNIFSEDNNSEMPHEVSFEDVSIMGDDGELIPGERRRLDADDREIAWLKKHYKGWTNVTILPPEQIQVESFPFTTEKLVELVADSKTKSIIERASNGDARAQYIVERMPADIVDPIRRGEAIPLNTDPDAGSFVYILTRKQSDYEARGRSILQRCLRTLVVAGKLAKPNLL